ncbi:MAG: transcription termination factor Rho [Myxococcota bacterium]
MPVDFPELHERSTAELRQQAKQLGMERVADLHKLELVFAIGQRLGEREGQDYGRGVLEVHAEGFGFLRAADDNFLPGPGDIYVSQSQIRRFKLQTGDTVIGLVRPPKEGERYTALLRVESVNGEPPGTVGPTFDSLTAIYPDERIALGREPYLRAIDLAAPIGLGQRGIVVAPARTGQADLLRQLAHVFASDEELHVTVLLLGERPEEIRDWRESCRAEIIATPFDELPSRHVQVADIVFERARRMVERGDDAVVLVDSFSRMLRFCLAETPPSGRTIGGVDTAALHRIRRYLGAARALEEGGSLTMLGVLQDDDSEMSRALLDDVRDGVNWELTLTRDIAARGIRPPIDLHRSGTRREERLIGAAEAETRDTWRLGLTGDRVSDAERLVELAKAEPLERASKSRKAKGRAVK